ncbi:MAG TPA: DUF1684 domain-containing protein [Cyclobacteriaceae bacterium]|nr:DUF1684 domain-containing protein [Cyclobacteriaceae bacterium]
MKSSPIIIVIAVAAVAIIIWYTASSGRGEAEYSAQVKKEREEKDEFMKGGEGSPFENATEPFTGLKYFEPNTKFRIVADLEPVENKQVVVLQTSDEKEQRYIEYARASFSIDGTPCKLLILEVLDSGPFKGTLFLAFADQSSAIETYGAGRYLDVKKNPGASSITLDFNEAYNPYCAYNDSFSCPFPPKENILNVLIAAGEKNYH